MSSEFALYAEIWLKQQLRKLSPIDERVAIGMNYITCAEYQLFIDEMQALGNHVQPKHWTTDKFRVGDEKQPILGVTADDAEAFCEWLTKKGLTPGFRYRLPTSSEVLEHPISEMQIGCWCQNEKSYVMEDIDSQQYQSWQQIFRQELQQPDLSTLRLDIPPGQISDLALQISSKVDFDLDYNLFFEFGSPVGIKTDFSLNSTLQRILELASSYSYSHNFENFLSFHSDDSLKEDIQSILYWIKGLSRRYNRKIIIMICLCLFTSISYVLGIDDLWGALSFAVLAFCLARTRAYILSLSQSFEIILESIRKNMEPYMSDHITNHVCQEIRVYLFNVFRVLNKIIYAFNDRIKKKNLFIYFFFYGSPYDEDVITLLTYYQTTIGQLYRFFSLIDLRQQGKLPAWEGIRIVRERIDK